MKRKGFRETKHQVAIDQSLTLLMTSTRRLNTVVLQCFGQ